ncbi:heme-binding protein [Mycolicibacterium aubagnense]|uniref:Membrane protein n=1 Tax=Mycolicibacterium aubagnense TaxID=319707 RepID=A0ABN5YV76_9MYCO|nr:heme-binding protein [Mycolicibacterium aubagnense]TLH70833.1 hemophore-related protein [Mycolicibacterium aubagnense]WGI32681.1 heme-binding protein [Mycolicibacterium aubagnense]BBX85697.1 membrane protein [Mycolicibacterium aubagnense]
MMLTALAGRRVVAGFIGAGVVAGGMLFGAVPSALADDAPPNCTAADLAGVRAGVDASTSAYLFTHPDVNDFFSSLRGLSKDQAHAKVKQYLAANPQTKAELQGIRQPLKDIRDRCGIRQ